MNQNELYTTCCYVFEEYYKQITSFQDFNLTISDNDKVVLNKFVDWLFIRYNGSAEFNLICQYTEYQFCYYYGRQTKFDNRVFLNWIFGKKAIERWNQASFNQKNFKAKFQFRPLIKKSVRQDETLKDAVAKFHSNLDKLDSNVEEEKRKLLNKPEGFLWCLSNTTLFNHKSSCCAICNCQEDCKNALKKHYPRLYQLRKVK